MEEEESKPSESEKKFSSWSNYEILIGGGSFLLMGLGECVSAAAQYALKALYHLELKKMPLPVSERVDQPPSVCCSNEMIGALIVMEHEQVRGSGFVFVALHKVAAKQLFEEMKLIKGADIHQIIDSCGEFCSLIAGAFRAEISKLGIGLVKVSSPKIYPNGVEEYIEGLKTSLPTKHTLNIYYQNSFLVRIEIAFRSEPVRR